MLLLRNGPTSLAKYLAWMVEKEEEGLAYLKPTKTCISDK